MPSTDDWRAVDYGRIQDTLSNCKSPETLVHLSVVVRYGAVTRGKAWLWHSRWMWRCVAWG